MSVLLVLGEAESAKGWREAIASALPEEAIVLPGPGLDRAAVTVALVAAPPAGSLRDLPGLRLIQCLWAGVDGLLGDPSVPVEVPLARLADPALRHSMVESVLLHVLSLHRQMPAYRQFQAERLWRPLPQKQAGERHVSVLGLGELGRAASVALAGLGFAVSGWSRSAKEVGGVRCLAGDAGLAELLQGCEILVNLLPLTAQTEEILSAELFAQLPDGAALINLGRGRHLVEADLLAALDRGRIGYAVLDVLAVEPVPATHPFWTHPHITLTPHVSAATSQSSAAVVAATAIRALRDGQPIANLVQRRYGY